MGKGVCLVIAPDPATVAKALAGNEEAIRSVVQEFVMSVRDGKTPAPHVMKYIADMLQEQLRGHRKDYELGLPRRGRGQPTKRRRGLDEMDRASKVSPLEKHHRQLALAVERLMHDGKKLNVAYEMVAAEYGVAKTTVRAAWKRWWPIARFQEIAERDPRNRAIAALRSRWGDDVVEGRFLDLGLWERFDDAATQAMIDFAKTDIPPEAWVAPPITESPV
jgi:hypothetical protein